MTLDGGISLEQANVIDNYGRGVTSEEFKALPENEITDDWRTIPDTTLDGAENIAHLDEKGYRYYIPAFMLRLLNSYDPGSMMTIGTLSSLYPKTDSQTYCYSCLTGQQLRAIAEYVKALPSFVELWGEDKRIVERAYRNYWSKYVESNEI